MREILFRGKRIDNREWVYGTVEFHLVDGDLTKKEQKAFITFDCMDEIGKVYRDTFEVDPETVGQFTEKTDRNEKKIFEGDIVKNGSSVYVVRWANQIAGYAVDRMNNPLCLLAKQHTNVIGNIYNHQELLTE